MKLSLLTKGTKLKLSKDWLAIFHEETYDCLGTKELSVLLKRGTVLSLHDIDIRNSGSAPRSVRFYIGAKCCPNNPTYEQKKFFVHFKDLDDLEFELNSKADKVLNEFDEALKTIKEEIHNK